MKNILYISMIFFIGTLGCNNFLKNAGNSTDAVEKRPTNANGGGTTASPSPKEVSKDDFVGRWHINRDFKDHYIEFRDDGTGTITLDQNGKTEAKQDFTWNFEGQEAVFTIKKPVVDPKSPDADGLTIHAQVIEGGTKLKMNFSPYTRTKGEDPWDKA